MLRGKREIGKKGRAGSGEFLNNSNNDAVFKRNTSPECKLLAFGDGSRGNGARLSTVYALLVCLRSMTRSLQALKASCWPQRLTSRLVKPEEHASQERRSRIVLARFVGGNLAQRTSRNSLR